MIKDNNAGCNNVVIVSSIYEAKKLRKFNFNLPVLCMSAEIFFFLQKKKNKQNLNLIRFFLTKDIEEDISDNTTNEFEKNYNRLKNLSISISTIEIIKVLITKNMYSLSSINIFLDNYDGFYFFKKNQFEYTNAKDIVIDRIVSKNKNNISFIRKNNIKTNFSFFIYLINKFIFYFNKKRNIIWMCAKKSRIENLLKELNSYKNKDEKVFCYYFYSNSNLLFLKILKSLYLSIFSQNKIIPILPIKKKIIIDEQQIKSIILLLLNNNLKKFKNIIYDNLIKSIEDVNSYESYAYEIISNYNVKLLITDQIRWKDGIGVASAFKRKKIPVFLISHNTHTLSNTDLSNKIQFHNSYGLLESDISSFNVIQSEQAYLFYKNYFNEKKIVFSKPIMWGYKNQQINHDNNNEFIIVIADTIKSLYQIPLIYEDSYGYLDNITEILDNLEKIDNVKTILRFRPDSTISLNLMIDYVKKYKNIHLSTKGDFFNVIKNANLLISHSSTTIEEAMNFNIPVGLYPGKNEYYHISKINKHNHDLIYNLSKKNFANEISDILNKTNKLKNKSKLNKSWNINNNALIDKINEYL